MSRIYALFVTDEHVLMLRIKHEFQVRMSRRLMVLSIPQRVGCGSASVGHENNEKQKGYFDWPFANLHRNECQGFRKGPQRACCENETHPPSLCPHDWHVSPLGDNNATIIKSKLLASLVCKIDIFNISFRALEDLSPLDWFCGYSRSAYKRARSSIRQ